MKSIEELLKNLGRAEVLEFGLVTNRLPSVNIGGKFEPVDDEAPTTDVLLQMLVAIGGSSYVDKLSERPVQWTARLSGVGVIAVAAIMRKEIVQARFTVARRDTATSSARLSAAPQATPTVQAKEPPPSAGVLQARSPVDSRRPPAAPAGPAPNPPAVAAAGGQAMPAAGSASVGSLSAAPPMRPIHTPSSAVQKAAPQAPPAKPAPSVALGGPAAPVLGAAAPPSPIPSVPAGPPRLGAAVPPPEDWDEDDDEPTVQTLSPPVGRPATQQPATQEPARQQPATQAENASAVGAPAPAPAASSVEQEPKPKPARKPGDVEAPGAPAVARAADDRQRTEERKAAEEREAHERSVIEERAAAERKAAEERELAERAVAERAVAEQAQAARAASEQRAAIERAAAERARAAERALAERKAADRAKVERRISTPTSVDRVDVEITTSDSGKSPVARALELDGIDGNVELTSPAAKPGPLSVAAAPQASPAAVPSASPTPAVVPNKEPLRADGPLESFLALAVAARATDLLLVPGRPALVRVATDLVPRTPPLEPEHLERIAREIVPARLRATLEANGACDFAIDHTQHGRFRVNVSRQRTGSMLSVRVISHEIPTVAGLELPEGVARAATFGRGLVLVTGPSGHGKTNTLAAIVDIINRDSTRHVLTIEDPVEFVHSRKRCLISQREVGTHAHTLASALEASSREDADVIVIGELRDADELRMAIRASEAGRLVIGTMNTPSAAKTIDHMISMFSPAEQPQIRSSIANVLRLVIGQRLLPSVDRTRLHAATELLPSSIALYTLIRDARTLQIPSLQQRGRALGVVRLDESLASLVQGQKVTPEVAKLFAESPHELEAHVARAVARKG